MSDQGMTGNPEAIMDLQARQELRNLYIQLGYAKNIYEAEALITKEEQSCKI
jgi:hypothetical protein